MASATDYAAGLRDLADWIEDHPYLAEMLYKIEAVAYPPDTIESVRTWASGMGHAEKDYTSDTFFRLRRMFGPIPLEAVVYRSTVCDRIVTEREVTETIPDPSVIVPMIEVTKTVETVTWECKPILEEVPA